MTETQLEALIQFWTHEFSEISKSKALDTLCKTMRTHNLPHLICYLAERDVARGGLVGIGIGFRPNKSYFGFRIPLLVKHIDGREIATPKNDVNAHDYGIPHEKLPAAVAEFVYNDGEVRVAIASLESLIEMLNRTSSPLPMQ